MTARLQRAHADDLIRVVRMKELMELLGAGETTIRRWMLRGDFPKPIRLSVRHVGWLLGDVERWIKERKGGV
jgi:prophage regulatory protein